MITDNFDFIWEIVIEVPIIMLKINEYNNKTHTSHRFLKLVNV